MRSTISDSGRSQAAADVQRPRGALALAHRRRLALAGGEVVERAHALLLALGHAAVAADVAVLAAAIRYTASPSPTLRILRGVAASTRAMPPSPSVCTEPSPNSISIEPRCTKYSSSCSSWK